MLNVLVNEVRDTVFIALDCGPWNCVVIDYTPKRSQIAYMLDQVEIVGARLMFKHHRSFVRATVEKGQLEWLASDFDSECGHKYSFASEIESLLAAREQVAQRPEQEPDIEARLIRAGISESLVSESLARLVPLGATSPKTGRDLLESARLERRLTRWQKKLMWWSKQLDAYDDIAPRQCADLAEAKTLGVDGSAAEAALAAFQQHLAAARASLASAANLLGAPAGFDGNGQVIDLTQAYQTLAYAKPAIERVNSELREARRAFRAYRMANAERQAGGRYI